jgi:hypothetical protein
MASAATLSVSVTFDNGPKLESKGKLDPGSFVFIDEELCRCSPEKDYELLAGPKGKIEMIVVTAVPYAPEKENCTGNGSGEKKRIKFRFKKDGISQSLNGPFVVRAPFIEKSDLLDATLESIWLENQMPLDAKVSVLVVRRSANQDEKVVQTITCTGPARVGA